MVELGRHVGGDDPRYLSPVQVDHDVAAALLCALAWRDEALGMFPGSDTAWANSWPCLFYDPSEGRDDALRLPNDLTAMPLYPLWHPSAPRDDAAAGEAVLGFEVCNIFVSAAYISFKGFDFIAVDSCPARVLFKLG